MNKRLIATVLVVSGFGSAVLAQQGAPVPEDALAVLPVFEAVDANKDGMIDSAESEALSEVLKEEHEIVFEFDAVDENSDGLINSQEYVAYDTALKEELGIA